MADETGRNRDDAVVGTRRLAKAAMVVERLWPLVLSLAIIAAVYLILSWFGVFAAIPFAARALVMAGMVAAFGYVLWSNRRFAWPTAAEVDGRIELSSRLAHQPLRTQTDRLPDEGDSFASALWREHQRRMADRLKHLTGGSVRTQTERLDPYGLRAVVLLLLVTAFAFSLGPTGGRLGDAFVMPQDGLSIAERRVDAWVTPPSYTGKAPIFLAGPSARENADDAAFVVPQGSMLSVRVSDGSDIAFDFAPSREEAETLTVLPSGSSTAPETAAREDGQSDDAETGNSRPAAPAAYELALTESGTATLGTTLSSFGAWQFDVTPDAVPTISFVGEPATGRTGTLDLAYRIADDYGVKAAHAEILLTDDQVAPDAQPLVAPPEIRLSLPRRTRGEAEARTTANLVESPYAGAEVALTLVAHDDADQIGRSQTKHITLPERRFTNPLARAVVEQRRILALDANAVPRVVEMLDAITLHGDTFIPSSADYVALKAARTRIATAYDEEGLISAVDFLWQIALGIEDGNLSLAEQRLRDAREQLSEALENGATDEEIDQLMAELREAMQEYMQAMAEAMQNQPQNQMQMGDMQELRPQDLDRMLDQIEDLAKSGSKDAAQQLLSELQQMMDSLQAMQPGQQQQQGENPMQEQMNKMGELLQDQQRLMDETYDLGRQQYRQQQEQRQPMPGEPRDRGQPQPGEQGEDGEQMTAEQMQEMMRQLQEQQGALQEQLEQLQSEMEAQGMQPSDDLGEAGEAMGQAEGALGEGDDGEAVGQQGRAMEAMRRGAQDMMDQMQQAMGQGQPGGPGGQGGQGMNGQPQQSGRDPLGRQRQTQGPQFGQDVGVPDEIDAQRARQILEAIRDRLGDQLSPELERQYLERLLQTP